MMLYPHQPIQRIKYVLCHTRSCLLEERPDNKMKYQKVYPVL
jgi:hypothetical protein